MNIQPTTTITIDDATFEVAKMSPQVQQLVQYFDQWRQDEANAASELLKARAAIKDVQNTLTETIVAERKAAAEAAQQKAAEPAPAKAAAKKRKATA